jgi:hypothetical protein
MSNEMLVATDYEVPAPGQHHVRIEEVKKRDGKFGPYYRLGTKVVGGEFDGQWVSFVGSAKLTPAAKLRIAIEDVLGRKLKKGEKFNPQTLVGHEAVAEVSNNVEDERTYANIERFYPLLDGFRQAQEAVPVREASEANEGSLSEAEGHIQGEEEPLPDYNE